MYNSLMKKKVVAKTVPSTKKKTAKKAASWGSPKKRDQYTVVLEEIRSDFKVFGENLQMTREVLGGKIEELQSDMSVVKSDVRELKSDVRELKSDMREVKSEIVKINERIAAYDVRLAQLEQANLELLHEIRNSKVEAEVRELRSRVQILEEKLALQTK